MAALLLVVVAWLPGAILFRVPWADREKRARLPAEERVFWSVTISVALSCAVTIALAAAGAYTFERLVLCDLGVAAAAGLLGRGGLRSPASRPGLTALIPLVILVAGLWRFSPPSEYVLGGKDPGTYVNQGVQLAQRGSLIITDQTIASVPASMRDLFFPSHETRHYYGTRFMGFFVKDPAAGIVAGQFPHLFPASLAIGYGINGLTGVRWVTPLWAILGLVAVYFAAARLFGPLVAAAAIALLLLNVVTVWFARYPNAEVVMQAFLFAALLANARAHVDDDRFFAPVAGGLLALLLFLRFDAVLGLAGVATGLALSVMAGSRPRLSFLATFAALAVLALFYYLGPLRTYAAQPIAYVSALPAWQVPLMLLAATTGAAGLWLASRRPAVRAAGMRYVPVALAVILCALGIYALYLRHPGGRLAAHDAYALRAYASFYVTVPAVLAALIGFAMFAGRAFWRDPALFTTVAIFATSVFFKIRIVPEHFWAARRFLPVVLPATMLFAAAAALGSSGRGWRLRVVRPLLGSIFLLLLAGQYARASRPLARHVEYEGVIPHIEQLAARFGDRDLVIVESRDAQSDVHVLATPLAYIYARHVLLLNSARPDKAAFAAFIAWARTRYAHVYFLGGGGSDLLSHRYALKPLSSDRFQVPEYESALNLYPRGVRRKEFEFGLYEFIPPDASSPGPDWFDLDVGANDDLHVLRFHAREQTDGRSFRWTQARSYISVTTIGSRARDVTLVLGDGGRPSAAAPVRVDVYLHNQQLGTLAVTGTFRPYTLPIPSDLAARASAAGDPVELRFVSTTWQPSVVLGSGDDRTLGVMVDRVTIK